MPIPEAQLDYVRGEARYCFPETALLNAHGIAGANVSLLLKAPRSDPPRPQRHKLQPPKLNILEYVPKMTPTNFILVAHDRNALRQASKLAKILEPFAEVQLCSYELSKEQLPQEPDALLCVVTDDESVELAHDFQGRLEDVPTFVVDSSGSLKIEPNGYAGRVSTSPEQVLGAVRQFLAANEKRTSANIRRETPQDFPQDFDALQPCACEVGRRRPVAASDSHRLGPAVGLGSSGGACRSLPAHDRDEYLSEDLQGAGDLHRPACGSFSRSYPADQESGCTPTTPDDLQSRSFGPLNRYLANTGLNLLVPLARETRLLGWIAFRLETGRCTDDLLDDLQVAAHLLATSLAEAQQREDHGREAHHLKSALAALNSGIVVVSPAGQIACAAGTGAARQQSSNRRSFSIDSQ